MYMLKTFYWLHDAVELEQGESTGRVCTGHRIPGKSWNFRI